MYPVRVKICGVRSADEAKAAVAAGVHALGFVFADSPREITPGQAADIIKGLPPFIVKVGVFVNDESERVSDVAGSCGLDTLQFHGEEMPEYCSRFPGYKIIKAFPAVDSLTIEKCALYDIDALLLDTCYPDRRGGGGKTFNWNVACSIKKDQRIQTPVILAGGLSPENVTMALDTVKPFGVDVSSGVEKDKKKDPELIRRFMSRVYNWNQQNFME